MPIDTSNIDPNAATIFEEMEARIAALEIGEITINIPQVIEIQYTFTDGTVRTFAPSSGSTL